MFEGDNNWKKYVFFIILLMLLIFTFNQKSDTEIFGIYSFDKEIYTQGLAMIDNQLIISSGLYGKSKICEYNFKTQEVVFRKLLDEKYFGEGITYDGKNLIQLTWQEKVVFAREVNDYSVIDKYSIKGEGWGICFNDGKYYVSNGSEYISVYNASFNELYKIKIQYKNKSVFRINELEFYNGMIYANQLDTCNIYKINPLNGNVVKKYDLQKFDEIAKLNKIGSMNGIAKYKDNMFYITGKNWDKLFLIQLN